jgi:thiamine pyrophosphate-dependent acetolactate synthase large subunit-like protein
MAFEAHHMPRAEAAYQTSSLGGNYAGLAREMGAHAERIEEPEAIVGAIERGTRFVAEQGEPALVEFITARETAVSEAHTNCRPVRHGAT